MCGIVGYLGHRDPSEVIIKGLKRLEYRGYDSAGIALHSDSGLVTQKCAGKVKELEKLLSESSEAGSNLGIGHTRWATHGVPNTINAHPHSDTSGKITLVHNGIIENYGTLKKHLKENGIECQSDTDTEVLVQFIAYLYEKEKLSFSDTVRLALKEVVGAYGIAVLCKDEPDTMIAARFGSPLVLGIGENEWFIGSDTSPIIEYTRNIVFLDEGEMATITRSGFEVININENHIVAKDIEEIKYSLDEIEKSGFDFFMLKEIFEQPKSIQESMRGRIDLENHHVKLGGIQDWLQRIIDAKNIYITACGTSWHAALIGSFLLEEIIQKPVKVEYASELRYRPSAINSDTVLFSISQSGETADTLAAIKKTKELGAFTVGIVNAVGSSIARETDCGVYIHAGPEIGVASTKAFTSQVSVLSMMAILLAQRLGKDTEYIHTLIEEMVKLPTMVQSILDDAEHIEKIAGHFVDSEHFLYLGRGYQFPVALEGALKLKEISYIHAEGYPAAEMKHGPIALIDENMPVVFIVTEKGYGKIVSNIQEVKARGGRVIIVTSENAEELSQYSDHIITIPSTENALMPIITTIPLQLLAYYIAVLKGCDVDQPRNLAKSVTVE
ncbi:MAG: glutamine--fructose-6-phosphate transaminase (isomerizing) [Candidatus Marinimicrobia bacterium]|nr:glutamine--fructose-6-phosphate transaminase (isomerizing) [Candidatus Neomarinimicrobiota bacterium]